VYVKKKPRASGELSAENEVRRRRSGTGMETKSMGKTNEKEDN
jgi:hypothetical protein